MSVRVGGHVGPVYASKRVSGQGCGVWLIGALVIAPLFVFWYVTLPVLAIIVLSVITIRVRDKRRARRAEEAAAPVPGYAPRHGYQPRR